MERMTRPNPPPEADLIERLRRSRRPTLSIRSAAEQAGLSEGRWRQIAKGYQAVTKDVVAPVVAPADTLARMAIVVGASPEELEDAGRVDAAELVMEQQPEIWQQWQQADATVEAIRGRDHYEEHPLGVASDDELMEELTRRYLLRRIETEPAFAAKMRRAAGLDQKAATDEAQQEPIEDEGRPTDLRARRERGGREAPIAEQPRAAMPGINQGRRIRDEQDKAAEREGIDDPSPDDES